MQHRMWLPLCLFSTLAHAAEPAPATSPHDLGYSLGASLGTRLHD